MWDVGEDCGTNIRIEPKKGVVAATFNKLVEKITSEKDLGKIWIGSRVGKRVRISGEDI